MFTCSSGGHMLSVLIGSTSLGFPTLVTQNCTLRAMVSALAFPGAVRRP